MYEIGFNMREGVIIFLQDENIYDTYILDVLYLERVFTGFLLVLI